MLDVKDLSVVYGKHQALSDISIAVDTGELVVILGANGAGKSSLLRALAGLCEGEMSGQVTLDGRTISGLNPDEIVHLGVALVPEGRAIFGDLSVEENLKLGAYAEHARHKQHENLSLVFKLFPKLQERRKQVARTMSGGEQQMVAIGRALMSAPSILMLDEPSLGLSPLLSKELFQVLAQIREAGIGVLVVEQNAKLSLSVADRGYLIEVGSLVGEDSAENLSRDPAVQAAYLGASGASAKPVAGTGTVQSAANSSEHRYIQPAGLDGQVTVVPFAGADAMGDLLQRAAELGQTRYDASLPSPLVGARDGENKSSKSVQPSNNVPAASPHPQPFPHKGGKGAKKPRTVNLLQPEPDDRITALLQEFEDAAAAARLPQNQISATPSQDASHSKYDHEDEPLPTISVFRKSEIQVFKRDQHGVLQQMKRK